MQGLAPPLLRRTVPDLPPPALPLMPDCPSRTSSKRQAGHPNRPSTSSTDDTSASPRRETALLPAPLHGLPLPSFQCRTIEVGLSVSARCLLCASSCFFQSKRFSLTIIRNSLTVCAWQTDEKARDLRRCSKWPENVGWTKLTLKFNHSFWPLEHRSDITCL